MPAGSPNGQVERSEFATADPLVAREFMDRAYGGRLLVQRTRESTTRVALSHADAGDFTVSDLRFSADLTFRMTGQGTVIINTVFRGAIQRDRRKGADRFAPGDVYIANYPGADYLSHVRDIRTCTITFPAALLGAVAGTCADGPAAPPRFLSLRPLDAAARDQWKDAADFAVRTLANPRAHQPLLLGNTARLLAATALAAFPNTVLLDGDTGADRSDAAPAALRRAIAYIEDHHTDPDITVADIAAAAGVTPRTLQYAFRRHRGTTPMGYVRRVRLAAAHADLQAAGPGTTVTAVAARWGFHHPGRFAADYRAAYGRSPSTTLRA
ncbi:helix-turn-helix domain-containing protein [Spirillospora sp. NPDC029432]|uniref:AraC family transcriptional regulator n=1 Tax=Spirillospora sp. NPDC029432 TaxID=3154599 RepID=UPI003455D438